jgi:hypothetical protein
MRAATKLFFSCIVCCFLGVPAMLADTLITQTCAIAVQGVNFTDNTCSFNSFDSDYGTLESVTLQITGVGGTVLPEQNNTSSTYTITFTKSVATIEMDLTGPDGTVASVLETSRACSGSVGPNSTNKSCSQTSFGGLSGDVVSATDLTAYEAVGTTFLVPVTASGYIASAGGSGGANSAGNLFFGGDGSIGGTLVLTYTFIAPEPTSPVLCGGSLLILAAFLRKRHLQVSEQ